MATEEPREWIIQRCTWCNKYEEWNAFTKEYEDWSGYSERLMTHTEMLEALNECKRNWPEHEFRGLNIMKESPRSGVLRVVR